MNEYSTIPRVPTGYTFASHPFIITNSRLDRLNHMNHTGYIGTQSGRQEVPVLMMLLCCFQKCSMTHSTSLSSITLGHLAPGTVYHARLPSARSLTHFVFFLLSSAELTHLESAVVEYVNEAKLGDQ